VPRERRHAQIVTSLGQRQGTKSPTSLLDGHAADRTQPGLESIMIHHRLTSSLGPRILPFNS
jgi:hypothetical protein